MEACLPRERFRDLRGVLDTAQRGAREAFVRSTSGLVGTLPREAGMGVCGCPGRRSADPDGFRKRRSGDGSSG